MALWFLIFVRPIFGKMPNIMSHVTHQSRLKIEYHTIPLYKVLLPLVKNLRSSNFACGVNKIFGGKSRFQIFHFSDFRSSGARGGPPRATHHARHAAHHGEVGLSAAMMHKIT